MTTALLIPVEGEIDWTTIADSDSGLDTLQALVGGYIEAIEVPVSFLGKTVYLTAYLNEESKLKNLPFNGRATHLTRDVLFPTDYIAGPLVLMGPPDREGNDTDAPEWLRDVVQSLVRSVVNS